MGNHRSIFPDSHSNENIPDHTAGMVFCTLAVVGRSPYSDCEPVDLMDFMEVTNGL